MIDRDYDDALVMGDHGPEPVPPPPDRDLIDTVGDDTPEWMQRMAFGLAVFAILAVILFIATGGHG